ncbi:MAG: glucosyltransferase domain-containing protein, partial [Desulfovibrio sp.]|nr:glucosyltransferase domain-containing protein [Desulfovibrio sp.]
MKTQEDHTASENSLSLSLSLSLSRWLSENYKLLVSVFLIGLFAYGFSVVNYSFLLDHDSAFIRNGPDFVINHARINRWAMIVYYYLLLPGVFYPFIGNILALFFVSLAYCMFITNHPSLSFSQKLLFCGIAVSLPTFGPMFNFSFMVAQVSCSISFVVFAYLLTINGNTFLTRCILPILLCSFATFTYQSLIYIFPGLFLIDCLLNKFNMGKKSTYRVFLRVVVICIISLICYVGGSELLHLITGISQHQHPAGKSIYLRKPIIESFIS